MNIGEFEREVYIEPMPEKEPIVEPVPEREPEKVPA
jgi:hypothetical protein